ncbi:Orn/Lys/Arg decarboxylase N-terminal domain-containing protein [uncultured Thiodictyon sp.]|uniref:Orn/Lys/Arg family decarboxylase n=1 Tax=uncultured Thiodictyon sp. TaxID=1846217 RepID=UPI0025EE1D59|nr:Orn/Lys/Arg decarboxylase N-terminal domain-containing protein [uncultured Thiodictyon sp.]
MQRREFIVGAAAGTLVVASDTALARSASRAQREAPPLTQPPAPACLPGAAPKPAGSGDPLAMRALLVSDTLNQDTALGRRTSELRAELERRQVVMVLSGQADDARAIVGADPALQCLLLDWDLAGDYHTGAMAVLDAARAHNAEMPIFLLADRTSASAIPLAAMQSADDFIWMLEDTTDFIGGRIVAAIERYRARILPPMFKALVEFSRVYEYSWHTPGHTGGTAFLKSPAGRAYHAFFGESLLRSDLSISVGELGSLLDHSGPIGDGERNAARVFGAHRTYYVTNGSSTSNRVILMASVTRDQVALCDRNCHKSVEHAMTMSGAIPTYLIPSRNALGLIGPIRPERLSAAAIKAAIADNPLVTGPVDPTPVHAVITNSTYDGLCYHVGRVEELLGASVDRLHFDEAWYGYARFNPLYQDRHAMHGDPAKRGADQPTVFATQSTHKLLAALSQASMIHVRDGRRPIPHERFNEAFMMHASTSPLYPLIASIDCSAAMMDGPGGLALTTEAIREAVDFRQGLGRLGAELKAKGDWFFSVWQPEMVTDPGTGRSLPFHLAPAELLTTNPAPWVLRPGAAWHGFGDIADGYCLLDPIKVSVVTPGISPTGALGDQGIPAAVVTAFLDAQGIVAEKTTDFTILFLFSLGITKGKWGTLINAFLDFKRHYDANTPLPATLPALVESTGTRYAGLGLKDLCDTLYSAMRELRTTGLMAEAFSVLPRPSVSPVRAYESLVRGQVKALPLQDLAGRVVATGVVPYPPGIPLLMPGEEAGAADGPVLGYLKALEAFDGRFPGFTHETHGVEVVEGGYRVLCLEG